MNLGKQFKEGLITNNPVLVQVLGMCSAWAWAWRSPSS